MSNEWDTGSERLDLGVVKSLSILFLRYYLISSEINKKFTLFTAEIFWVDVIIVPEVNCLLKSKLYFSKIST